MWHSYSNSSPKCVVPSWIVFLLKPNKLKISSRSYQGHMRSSLLLGDEVIIMNIIFTVAELISAMADIIFARRKWCWYLCYHLVEQREIFKLQFVIVNNAIPKSYDSNPFKLYRCVPSQKGRSATGRKTTRFAIIGCDDLKINAGTGLTGRPWYRPVATGGGGGGGRGGGGSAHPGQIWAPPWAACLDIL